MRLYRLRRHPVGFWCITFLLAALTALTVLRLGARADAEVDRWGRLSSVVVVARDVPAGTELDDADVRLETLPARLVPADAAVAVDDVVGQATVVALSPGEVVLQRRLAPHGLTGVAALVAPGMRAVAVPVDGAGVRLQVGDTVDVLAPVEQDPSVVVAEAAAVVDVQDDAVTLAVPVGDSPRLAFAVARATITLSLTSER